MTKSMIKYDNPVPIQANTEVWRIARWLYLNCTPTPLSDNAWVAVDKSTKMRWYNIAVELNYQLINNNFTGSDNHGD